MIDADTYMNVFAQRAQAQRARVQPAQVGPLQALVADSYESMGLSEVRYCVIVAAVPEVNGFVVGDFTRCGVAWASTTMRGVKGLTGSAITIVGLVSARVSPDAVSAATSKPSMEFSGAHRSVVVDLTSGGVHSYTGSSFREFAVSGTISTKLRTLFPAPGEVAAQIAQMGPPPGPGAPHPPGPPQGPPPGPQGPPPGPYHGPGPYGPPQGPPPPPPGPYGPPHQGAW
ncbi:MAG TPA: hypothetical protein VGL93_10135 [Streptosporangiaceae bacterium]|jgi:hypothetical protein